MTMDISKHITIFLIIFSIALTSLMIGVYLGTIISNTNQNIINNTTNDEVGLTDTSIANTEFKKYCRNGEDVPENFKVYDIEGKVVPYLMNDGNFVYNIGNDCEIKKIIDAASYEYITNGYGVDKNSAYSYINNFEVDIATFEVLSRYWTKDQNNFYHNGNIIENIDRDTFEVVESGNMAKDKNNLYIEQAGYYKEPLILNASEATTNPDLDTFTHLQGNYYIDKNNAYLWSQSKQPTHIYEEVDTATFEILGTCRCVEKSCSSYIKDKNNVYCYKSVMVDADAQSFEFIGLYDENPGGLPVTAGIAKDKTCIYRNGEKTLDANGKCVSPINCTEDNIEEGCIFE